MDALYGEALAVTFGFGMVLGMFLGGYLATRTTDRADKAKARAEWDALDREFSVHEALMMKEGVRYQLRASGVIQ